MGEPATVIAVDDKPAAKAARSKPSKPLPTNRIKFNKQLDLLRAYVAASKEGAKSVTNKEVGDVVDMVETTVSLANAFLCDLGLLTRAADGFAPSQDAIAFKRAYDWKPEGAAHKLAPAIRQSWFGDVLIPKLAFGPMSEDDALARLAEATAASPDYKPQLAMLIEYMSASGVVERDGGFIKLSRASASTSPPPEPSTPSTPIEPPDSTSGPAASRAGTVDSRFAQSSGRLMEFHISVEVDAQELSAWSPDRIKAFFEGVALVMTAKAGLERVVSGKD